jgi:hypothetical protein
MISVKEQFSNACGCGNAGSGYVGFDGDNETDEQTSDYLGFSGTDDEGEFDEFLGKKGKEKRAIKKELMAQGVSRKDARKQANEKVGGGGIMEAIEKVKAGVEQFRDKTGIGAGAGSGAGATGGGENTGSGDTAGGSNRGADTDSGSEAFNWKPYAIWGGVGIAVLAIGIIAYRKFAKK